MKREEIVQVMAVLATAYPHSFRNISDEDAERTLDLWAVLFADDDAALVAAAVKAIIVSDDREFAPTIGVVKEKMRQLTARNEMTGAEAWSLIAKAVRNGCYGAQEEFDKLPPALQRIVGSPNQLREWAMMDSGTLHSVVASNVQKAYQTFAKRDREQAKLPADVKATIASITDRLALGEGKP